MNNTNTNSCDEGREVDEMGSSEVSLEWRDEEGEGV